MRRVIYRQTTTVTIVSVQITWTEADNEGVGGQHVRIHKQIDIIVPDDQAPQPHSPDAPELTSGVCPNEDG